MSYTILDFRVYLIDNSKIDAKADRLMYVESIIKFDDADRRYIFSII